MTMCGLAGSYRRFEKPSACPPNCNTSIPNDPLDTALWQPQFWVMMPSDLQGTLKLDTVYYTTPKPQYHP